MHARMQLLQNINLKQTRFAVIAEVPLIFTKDEVLSKDLYKQPHINDWFYHLARHQP